MKVGIVGFSCIPASDFSPKIGQFYELVFEVCKDLMNKVNLNPSNIDFFVQASFDVIDGRMISNMYTSTASGAYLKEDSRVSDDGLLALAYAYVKILSGDADIALVVSHRSREVDEFLISNKIFDPFYYRPLGMTFLHGLAFQAFNYIVRSRAKEEAAANIVVKNRRVAKDNPLAHVREEIDLSDVLTSAPSITPLREAMLPPESVGSIALILACEELAPRISKDVVWIKSIAWSSDSYNMGSKPLHRLLALESAAKRAYRASDINDPKREIDLFEIFDITPYHEIMAYEALGLAPRYKGWQLALDNVTDPLAGQIPVNVSGGVISSNPFPATSLYKLYEAYLQLLGKAGKRQLEKVNRALVHGFTYLGGACSQTHIVTILEV